MKRHPPRREAPAQSAHAPHTAHLHPPPPTRVLGAARCTPRPRMNSSVSMLCSPMGLLCSSVVPLESTMGPLCDRSGPLCFTVGPRKSEAGPSSDGSSVMLRQPSRSRRRGLAAWLADLPCHPTRQRPKAFPSATPTPPSHHGERPHPNTRERRTVLLSPMNGAEEARIL
jgi:hypothetical protein